MLIPPPYLRATGNEIESPRLMGMPERDASGIATAPAFQEEG
ncbi:hypothetical protein Bresa_00089|uniref:Uncharacterized protein n=1 Tax=Brenneria salicis ATCC 15712 = DSM 30166 TaxID=714314 RepID=A0A366HYQ9_9GAMM|nr:hypothetical protein [Brenneria salicis]NMN90056.1 hypothetical protein [Brenneria salicis ATCC 15712 = DSM 30166]RBP59262.1 hypothetical protein DES54_14125 [Brenneria salicis ATCC 15712 = DSM 30166]